MGAGIWLGLGLRLGLGLGLGNDEGLWVRGCKDLEHALGPERRVVGGGRGVGSARA